MESPAGTPTTIVIPLYNRAELTRVCVKSIRTHTPPHSYRLVLVDNGSTDGTQMLCRHLPGTTVLRNDMNRGFAAACNQGAAAADTPYVMFLNNDTWVGPGWLPPLVATLMAYQDTAAVGARLTYPDGSLQHAGVAVDVNDRGLLEARNLHTEKPRGPTEAVTGAAMMVDRRRFDEVGGFDEGYWNGYEDVDLCLQFRDRGWQIRYEPNSTIVHLESASGVERWRGVANNVMRLQEKWLGNHERLHHPS